LYNISQGDTCMDKERIFGAAISELVHEIRNSLNVVIGFSSFLQADQAIPEESRTYIKKIYQSGMITEHLLTDIDSFILDSVSGEPEEFTPLDAINTFIEGKKEFLEEKDIQFTVLACTEKKLVYPKIVFDRILENLFLFSRKGFKAHKDDKQIKLIANCTEKELVIIYSDSTEPVYIGGEWFQLDEILNTRRGLGPLFIKSYVEKTGGHAQYFYGKKWRAVPVLTETKIDYNHGFVVTLPYRQP
jgi:hypothetical protein